MCSRKTRTILPITTEDLKPTIVEGISEELKKVRVEQANYADRISNPMKPLEVGENVRMQGSSYRRNNYHLRRTEPETKAPPAVEQSILINQSTPKANDKKDQSDQQMNTTRSGRTVKPVQRYQPT